eukprot:TRINITY_DN12528_c0_g1_i10.p1 TRINITY_DN12528_c0_g1~~TRINITY_DN12528_c0_g1_i10.p1  ORF type:complete len:524 (-),score=79.45 TRINITY_DN12528_c0_g1_i10:407-1978(-)
MTFQTFYFLLFTLLLVATLDVVLGRKELLQILPNTGQQIDGGYASDLRIKMCRLRNCTLAEDMRNNLARAGLWNDGFQWFGLRTVSNSQAFYQALGDSSRSADVLSVAISPGSRAVSQLLAYGNVVSTDIAAFSSSSLTISGNQALVGDASAAASIPAIVFPDITSSVVTLTPPSGMPAVSVFYTTPVQTKKPVSSDYYYQYQQPRDTSMFTTTPTPTPTKDDQTEEPPSESPTPSPSPSPPVEESPPPPPPQVTPLPLPALTNASNKGVGEEPPLTPVPAQTPSADSCVATPAARINATGQLSILYRALEAANLMEFLNNPEVVVTLFAPTDSAFQGLLVALGDVSLDELLDNTQLVTAILLLHVVPDFALSAAQLKETAVLPTLLPNQNLTISVSPAGQDAQEVITIIPPQVAASANVLVPDVAACESIIHVTDGVFLGSTSETVSSSSSVTTGTRRLLQHNQNCQKHLEFDPCCSEYTLGTGERICDIAQRYEVDCQELRDLNDIQDDDLLQAGDVLQVC